MNLIIFGTPYTCHLPKAYYLFSAKIAQQDFAAKMHGWGGGGGGAYA